MGQDCLGGPESVGPEVGHLAQLDAAAEPVLGVRDGDALVQALVPQLAGVLRSDVVVEHVPVVDEPAFVEPEEVHVGAEGGDPEQGEDPVAQPARALRSAPAHEHVLPVKQSEPDEREENREPRARLLVDPGRFGGGRLGIHDLHRRREHRRHLAEGGDLGDREEIVPDPLPESKVPDRRPSQGQGALAQAGSAGGLHRAERLEALPVDRAPKMVGVVGIGLHVERLERDDGAEVPGDGRGAGFEHHRGG